MINNSFLKKVVALISGTVIAQIISLGVYPVLTRLYTPDDFAIFGLVVAIISPLSILATLRYDGAIVLPRKKSDAESLVFIAATLALAFCCLFLVINLLIPELIFNLTGGKLSYIYILSIPFAVLSIAFFQIMTYFGISVEGYRELASSKIIQSASICLFQILFSSIIVGSLVWGYVLGQLTSFVYLYIKFKPRLKKISVNSLITNAKKHADYPKYNAVPSFLDTFTLQLPIIFLAQGGGAADVGFIALAFRILAAPSAVIGGAIGQVYFKRLSDFKNNGIEDLKSEVLSTFLKLVSVGLLIFIPINIFGSEIFSLIFGETWRAAGEIAEVLSIAICLRFIVSPLSTIFGVTNNLKLGALWKVIYFISTLSVLFYFKDESLDLFLFYFVVNEVVLYFTYFLIIVYASSHSKSREAKQCVA